MSDTLRGVKRNCVDWQFSICFRESTTYEHFFEEFQHLTVFNANSSQFADNIVLTESSNPFGRLLIIGVFRAWVWRKASNPFPLKIPFPGTEIIIISNFHVNRRSKKIKLIAIKFPSLVVRIFHISGRCSCTENMKWWLEQQQQSSRATANLFLISLPAMSEI